MRFHAIGLSLLLTAAGAEEPGPTPAALDAPPAIAPDTDADAPAGDWPATLPPDRLTVAVDIPEGSAFGAIVQTWGLPAGALREAALPIHDLARIHARKELQVVLEDGVTDPVALRYELDEDHILVLDRAADGWTPRVEDVAYRTRPASVFLALEHSLWEDGLAAGLRPSDLVTLANLFRYEVDFNTELRTGAQLGLVGEWWSSEGRPDKLGQLHAVRLVNDGHTWELVRFRPDGAEEDGWYHPDGTSSERAFLRSPLAFSRVTSSFNPRRYHPILKTRRPHNGTDFGAPAGTPVHSVASGTVEFAGRSGGHGNFVKIRHDGTYTTSYSHLTRIEVRRGQEVSQGQRVGTVGSTGLATGPHLHFQMWKNGRFVDAMREALPTAPALGESDGAAFQEQVQRWMPQIPQGPTAATD